VLDVLADHGATTVFGLPGVHNLAFWGPARAERGTDPAPVVVRRWTGSARPCGRRSPRVRRTCSGWRPG
jgi:hypothetical protein